MRGKTDTEATGHIEDRMEAFRSKCRATGLKITPQRMAVYKALLESMEHPSAEVVFRQVRKTYPSISLDTVNRTLLTLSEIGAAFIVEGSGDAKRFDANLKNHQHFKCVKCKRIIDFHHEAFDCLHIAENLLPGCTVLRKTVYLEGYCDLCQDSHKG
ncbi:MAG: transcriptional repressor [Planctomycetes bacterium]|jgi:Fur family peroxide stress response transcriptional regulator|nr:transcriptional repressor [Planctomycetota bacterium]